MNRPPQPAARVPQPRIPPPVPSRGTMSPPRPVVRQPMPASQPQRQPQPQRRGPVFTVPNARQTQALQPMPAQVQVQSPALLARAAEPAQGAKVTRPPAVRAPVLRLFDSRGSLRQGILMAEVLGKPLGLREGY